MRRSILKNRNMTFAKLLVVIGALFFGYLFFGESPQSAERTSENYLILTIVIAFFVIVTVHIYTFFRSLLLDLRSFLRHKRSLNR